eukprot:1697831-Heterocapsa_arctica.AAC.1
MLSNGLSRMTCDSRLESSIMLRTTRVASVKVNRPLPAAFVPKIGPNSIEDGSDATIRVTVGELAEDAEQHDPCPSL